MQNIYKLGAAKTVLTLSALALVCGAALAANQDSTTVAQADVFKQFDTNKDKFIDQKEAAASTELTQLFASADADKDGKLSVAEFDKVLNGSTK